MSQEKARIRWRCHRGMLELDLLLLGFVDKHYEQLTQSQIEQFELLLTEPDPQIYAWLLGQTAVDKEDLKDIVNIIQCVI